MAYFYVYILECCGNSYYTGHTDDIEKRISAFASRYEAIVAEHQIKKWTRKKKEALILKNWYRVKELAKKKFLK